MGMDTAAVGVQGMEAVCADQGTGPTLLLVHGWGAWHRYWRHLWPRVVARFRCLAVDLPGHGWSERPAEAPYTVEWYADWLAALLEAKGSGPAVVVGHSMGGLVGLALAARHPERVRRLVAVNAPVTGKEALTPSARRLSSPWLLTVAWPFTASRGVLRWLASDLTSLAPMADEDLASIRMASLRALRRSARSIQGADRSALGEQVKAPALVITSGDDRIVRPAEGEALARRIPEAKRETVPMAGHCVMLEAPDLFHARLLPFLEAEPKPVRPPQW
jgi:pimeloyl-ACP methyl ester carboxylesterase